MQTPENRFESPASRSPERSTPGAANTPYDALWAASAASPQPSRSSRALAWVIGGLLAFSMLFLAFAAGMVFQRYVIEPDPASAVAAQPRQATSEMPPQIAKAWELVHQHYVDSSAIDDAAMMEGAIDGMLDTLKDEGHTRYMTPQEAQADAESLEGQDYSGVGIQVQDSEDGIVVITPIDKSPAMEAGVRSGDILISIDGRDVSQLEVEDVIGVIRGPEGTQVTLVFRRQGEPEPLTYTLTRRKIELSSVSWTMLEGDIADIKLTDFSSGSGNDLQAALQAAKDAGAKGVILDLRNNPGGYISEAIQVSSTFIGEGKPVFISQFRDGSRVEQPAQPQDVHIGDLPLVVLINQGSASSSEITSGAIKAHNPNATILGETTFGTGTVIQRFDLGEEHAVWLGTELWLTPEGNLIKNKGIRPDVLIGLPDEQTPFVPITNVTPEPGSIEDAQLKWAVHVINTGQAGSDNPEIGSRPDRAR